jgi:hypothetical protein
MTELNLPSKLFLLRDARLFPFLIGASVSKIKESEELFCTVVADGLTDSHELLRLTYLLLVLI